MKSVDDKNENGGKCKAVFSEKNDSSAEAPKNYYSIDEVAEMLGINVWTIRLWINRFDALKFRMDEEGKLFFAPEEVDKIGLIYRLSKKDGMTLEDVQKHLKLGSSISRKQNRE